ncbi:MAG: hypothetical protein A2600_11570 [Candidatus Lambdaproteobacteria bacterium RIFOXYD1_FULL_56_27]|uniref:Glycosyltransferase RgtA/B/C/D-like domain-containing protein n=1 Tax=Candidatus Lambdaproteobacteria bacterium RIFOXYD2_FULL_56_26 TaxID=1817773 RepID=A0A1F6GYI7_9PROT|nr:MAG: hypothetical protein A2426_06200 [Candidatus Lambdaproteobacteria bacterium RIFOXYC1_FULL_56_13]OGH03236.1 MAG: hypothetical protein A2557_00745 [Candidatus Lambdaproteobacteria bacterium RIFOXYD2_FULL_56_26]OGH08173.1 MAG: hypothetical protein A2600_11570 [Candidatus Lambdaproteobacteria bacterium RIFOXYD1_FULL_56_27]
MNQIRLPLGVKLPKLSRNRFLGLLCLLQVLTHLPFLGLPPAGQHTWRQVAAASQARNYFEEQADFLEPHLDIRVEPGDLGLMYKEFPLLYWLTGQSYRLTGFSHYNLRLVQLAVALLVILAAYGFARQIGLPEPQARGFTFFFSTAPYFYYYAITLLPDLAALGCFLAGVALVLPGILSSKLDGRYLAGSLLLCLAVLFKATWLIFGLPLAFLYLRSFRKKPSLSLGLMALGTAGLMLGLFYLQYRHQMALYEAAPWERAQETYLTTKSFPRDWAVIQDVLRQAVGTWLFGFHINLAALPFWLYGGYLAFQKRSWSRDNGIFWSLWLLSFCIYGLLFFVSFGPDGEYYMTPLLPFNAYLIQSGYHSLVARPKAKKAVLLFLCLIPIVMVYRVVGRWNHRLQVPEELLYRAPEIEALIPDKQRVLVVGDDGQIIFLYYLHSKGVAFSRELSPSELDRYHKAGFGTLVWFEPQGRVDNLKDQLIPTGKVGRFQVYQIRWAGL